MKTKYFITELFPKTESDNKNTLALYDLVKEWKSTCVIRPYYYFKFSPFIVNLKKKPIFFTKIGKIKILHIPILKIPIIKKYLFINPKRICRYFDKAPDIAVGHFAIGNRLAYYFSNKLDIPFSIGIHSSDIPIIENNNKDYLKMIEHAERIVCRSFSIANKLLHYKPEAKRKIFVANSGIDEKLIESFDFFKKKRDSLKDKKEISFTTVARLIPLKNIATNLKALAEFKTLNWKYVIIGDGPEKTQLEKLAQSLGLQDKVVFTGWLNREAVMKNLKKADIYLQVSAPETFGLVYLEAMAKGCIIVGAKGWGIDGIIKHKINGFLAMPKSINDSHKIIKDLMIADNHNLISSIYNEMYKTVHSFTQKEQSLNYLKTVDDILESSKTSSHIF